VLLSTVTSFSISKNMLEGKRLNAPKDSKIFYSWGTQTKQLVGPFWELEWR
jgi:hypothetical protein